MKQNKQKMLEKEFLKQVSTYPIKEINGKKFAMIPSIPRWGIFRLEELDETIFEIYYTGGKEVCTKKSCYRAGQKRVESFWDRAKTKLESMFSPH